MNISFKKNNTIVATLWTLFDRLSTQIAAFLIGIILARLLTPSDYGIIGMTTVFIAISNVFVDSGFGNALIRKLDRSDSDLSTAFFFNLCIGFIAYLILFLGAPVIASFFNEPVLIPIVRLIGLNIVFLSLGIVQTAILTAQLNMRLQAFISMGSLIPAGLIAIYAAYHGVGVYALALQTVISSCLKTVLLWYFAKWRPSFVFSKQSFQYLWHFGSKLLGANLIGTFFNEIYSVLIGKYIGKNDLGYYSKASHLNQNVNGTTTGIVQKISLPVLSKYQNDTILLKNSFSRLMRLLVLFIAPLSAILCFLANDIITLLWTDKWSSSVILFQFLIIGTMFSPISHLSLSLLQVTNRTDLILKLEFPKKITYCFLIAIGFYYGVVGLAFIQIFINLIASLMNMYPTKKILGYGYWGQLKDVFKYMIISYGIGIILYLSLPGMGHFSKILFYSSIFFSLYLLLLFVLKDEFVYSSIHKIKRNNNV